MNKADYPFDLDGLAVPNAHAIAPLWQYQTSSISVARVARQSLFTDETLMRAPWPVLTACASMAYRMLVVPGLHSSHFSLLLAGGAVEVLMHDPRTQRFLKRHRAAQMKAGARS